MSSLEPRVGERYLTAAGVPVQVLEVHEGIMVLQGLALDNRFVAPAGGYPLRPFKGEAAAFEARPSPYLGPQAKTRRGQTQPKLLAPLIDSMLLAGNKTMRGILRELRCKASAVCRSKDLRANTMYGKRLAAPGKAASLSQPPVYSVDCLEAIGQCGRERVAATGQGGVAVVLVVVEDVLAHEV